MFYWKRNIYQVAFIICACHTEEFSVALERIYDVLENCPKAITFNILLQNVFSDQKTNIVFRFLIYETQKKYIFLVQL